MLLNGFCRNSCLLRHTFKNQNMLTSACSKMKMKKSISLSSRINNISERTYSEKVELMRKDINYENIFKDSEFQLLKISAHGSLVPISEKDVLSFSNELSYLHEEEELKHAKTNMVPINALTKNPNETLIMKRLRKNAVKVDTETTEKEWNYFFQVIIGNEKTVKDFNFKIPKFPSCLDLPSLKRYLRNINAISFDFDTNGRQQLIFNQIKDLLENLYKLDGMLDIDIMHEFIKFFGNYTDQLRIVKVLKKFELLGILPNKDTLDLVIYKLNMIPNGQRKYWLQLYLQLGTGEWNVTTDLRTRALVCMLENPSKERHATFKGVINEGFPYSALKWNYIEDILSLKVSQMKFDFNKIFEKLVKRGFASVSDRLKTFEIYVRQLTIGQYGIISINQILVNQELETSDCWATIIEALILKDKIWEAYAVFNYARDRRIDVQKIVVLFLKHRKRVYHSFYKLEDFERQEIFLEVEKYLISLCNNNLKCSEKVAMDYQSIRIDAKHMSNFIEKSINEMTEHALVKELEHNKSFDLKIYKTELPWK